MKLFYRLCLAFIFALLFLKAVRLGGVFWTLDHNQPRVQDFYYHVLVYDAFFSGRISSPYLLQDQLRVLSDLSGVKVNGAMPIGQTPIALLVFAPFVLLMRVSPNLAYLSWTLLSFVVLGAGMMAMLRRLSEPFQVRALVVFGLAAFSSVTLQAVLLGQTTLFAAGILMLLLDEIQLHRMRRPLLLGCYVLLLAVKIPYVLILMPLLLFLPMIAWREMLKLFLPSMAVCLLIFALFGHQLFIDYFVGLKHYATLSEPAYQTSLVPETMTVLRSFLGGAFLLGVFGKIHSDLLLTGLFLGLGAALLAVLLRRASTVTSPESVEVEFIFYWLLALGWVLLFSPLLGRYEDFLMLIPTLLFFPQFQFVTVAVFALMFCNLELLGPKLFFFLGFPLKLVAIAFLLTQLARSRRSTRQF